MKYRKEIDGLRTLAVIPVILFHAGFSLFSGGYVGVDVFFVISGYLITSIIYNEIIEERFSIIQFYERRVRRILPAFFFVICVCIPFAFLWMLPAEFKGFSQSIIAANFISSNLLFWLQTDYFASSSDLKPLLHTWSLAIEEQFYVFFPLLLLLLKNVRQNYLLIILAFLISASLIVSEWALNVDPSASFYLLPTRAWELGIGSFLALSRRYWQNISGRAANIVSITGLGMVLYAVFFFNTSITFPGFSALIPVFGTVLLIASANQQTLVGKLLSLPPMVGIGLVSYSAYLWHWPVFAFARIRNIEEPGVMLFILLIGLTLFLAFLSWRFIEQPFRCKERFNRKTLFVLAGLFSVTLTVFGFIGHFTSGLPNRLEDSVIELADYAKNDIRYSDCHSGGSLYVEPKDSCILGDKANTNVAILGDSHATAISDQLSLSLSNYDTNLMSLTYFSCMPTIGIYVQSVVNRCAEYNSSVFDYISSNPKIDTVVLVGRWTRALEGTRFNNQEGGHESGESRYALPVGTEFESFSNSDRIDLVGNLIKETVLKYISSGKKVLLVYPIPEVGWHASNYIAKRRLFGLESQELSTSYDVFSQRNVNTYSQLDKIDKKMNFLTVTPEDTFCNSFLKNRCVATLDGKPLYSDDNHLNEKGSAMLSSSIVDAMVQKGWLKKRH